MQIWRRAFTTSVARLQTKPRTVPGAALPQGAQIRSKPPPVNPEILGKDITFQGSIRSVRKHKRFAFAELSNGSSIHTIQALLTPAQAADLSTGAVVAVNGTVRECPPGKEQSFELHAKEVNVLGEADPETYPIQKKYHSPEFLRHIPHLRFRTPFNSALARFRSECLYQLGQVLREGPRDMPPFMQVHPPIITSSDCEGAGETFTVTPREAHAKGEHFFRSPKYLSVSSQLHLEAYAAELGQVWTVTPTFRAEKSDTPRHLSEFYMFEAEANYLYNLDQLTNLVEHIIRNLVSRLGNGPGVEIMLLKRLDESGKDTTDATTSMIRNRWDKLMAPTLWPRMTYTHAIEELQAAVERGEVTFEHPPTWAGGLQVEHEKFIVDVIHDGKPVFVTDYPKAVKPFYMAPSGPSSWNKDPVKQGDTVACFDLLFPDVSEVAGGSLREHRLPELIQNMREHGMVRRRSPEEGVPNEATYPCLEPGEDLGSLQWYADLRRWGSAPHGGFGLGFDRFVGYLAGVSNVRDVVGFPRYFGRADC
ncbi:asparaginyl-tRNA synthetase [Aspergillus taichungensis]|uniref:Asparaginyl-tRNA synthetase n=1 Tax=Aspergillus taichungensis TaxID=482145 RepID=A0A2J5HTC0_9EURO|nr:asparaginyl-tRNA synthetase [Aspergillus taichungensis]